MSELKFGSSGDFLKDAKTIGYRDLQAYAKALGVGPRNVKSQRLIELISEHLDTLKEEPAQKKKSNNGPRRSAPKRPPRPLKSPPKKRPSGSLIAILNAAIESGEPKELSDHLVNLKPTMESFEKAIGGIDPESVSDFTPLVLDVVMNFYSNMSDSIRKQLAKKLFSISYRDDDTILFKFALRIAPLTLSASTKFWTESVGLAIQKNTPHAFELILRMGILRMELYRGPNGHRAAIRIVLDEMRKIKASKERKRLFLFLLEEMVENDEIPYYTLEELNTAAQGIL